MSGRQMSYLLPMPIYIRGRAAHYNNTVIKNYFQNTKNVTTSPVVRYISPSLARLKTQDHGLLLLLRCSDDIPSTFTNKYLLKGLQARTYKLDMY